MLCAGSIGHEPAVDRQPSLDHLDAVAGKADDALEVVCLAVARERNTTTSPRCGISAGHRPAIGSSKLSKEYRL